jgi:hypothetical protein
MLIRVTDPLRDSLLAQIDAVLKECGVPGHALPTSKEYEHQPDSWIARAVTLCTSLIDRLTVSESSYRQRSQQVFAGGMGVSNVYALIPLIGIVYALRTDIEAGYTHTLAELIHADVFSDFLDMAAELLNKGYKDPSAVIAGSVLEEHLRKLSPIHGVAVTKSDGSPKKADSLNAELAAVPVYNKLVHKQVTAWLGLRNSAAHGQYGDYDHGQVTALIRDVRDFMVRHPA